jgi:hypothetical protein
MCAGIWSGTSCAFAAVNKAIAAIAGKIIAELKRNKILIIVSSRAR